ncbi:MAG: DEAD/DEAH box helicase [Verrucomicrobiae bacterium]|nr:DEAD/DEAH box helicase [Verrucomicrobiae bacterium]
MIENEAQLQQARQQLQRLREALEALRAKVQPANMRRFELMAEGPLDQINELELEIAAYCGGPKVPGMMNPLHVLEDLQQTYRLLVETFQEIANDNIRAWMHDRIEQGDFLWRPPFLTLQRRFRFGEPLEQLVRQGLLHPKIPQIFRLKKADPDSEPIRPYLHQTEAWRIILGEQRNCVVTTGTGSGKSFCFAVPVVDTCLRANEAAHIAPAGRRNVKALLVYPMNALANSQYDDLAERLRGTGLTICNYTSELKEEPEAAKKAFMENMGREPYESEVVSRLELRQGRGADILVTNFMMLELILTRWEDRNIFPFGGLSELKFLVFDEIHTYTGRQGADVACLIRRLKEHTQCQGKVRCVGTSATIDSSNPDQARQTVASFAQDLFGEPFGKDEVVGEFYSAHLTCDPPDPLPPPSINMGMVKAASERGGQAVQALRDALCGKVNATAEDLRRQATVHFIERNIVPETPESAYQTRRWDELVLEYRERWRPTLALEEASAELAAALVASAETPVKSADGTEYPLLLPKVHAFFSQGQPVTACLGAVHLSATGEKQCARCDVVAHVPAFPLVFCAACGVELMTAELRREQAVERLFPRDLDYTECEGKPVYVFLEPWDRNEIPPDEAAIKKDGSARKGREGAVPINCLVCTVCGTLDGNCNHNKLRAVAVVEEPLLMCPACGVIYDGRVREFNKFFVAGMVGKATATDVLASRLLENVPPNPKRRVIAFTDNIQDAAFQAAHMTDLERRLHFRRALYHGLTESRHTTVANSLLLPDAGRIAFEAMKRAGRVPAFARQGGVAVGRAAGASEATYKKYLAFGAIGEISGYAYKKQPTLEMTGLVSVSYDGIAEVAAKGEFWSGIALLAAKPAQTRQDVLQVFLDVIRRAGGIESDCLERGEDFREEVINRLHEDVLFHSESLPPYRPTVFSDELDTDNKYFSVRRLAGAPGSNYAPVLVRWFRRQMQIDRPAAEELVRGLTALLARPDIGLLLKKGGPGRYYYQIPEGRILLYASNADYIRVCPRCRSKWEVAEDICCPACIKTTLRREQVMETYYRLEYQAKLEDRQQLLAVEHTSRISADERRSYERRFDKEPQDPLNVLVCTPTMELGVDIAGLSAVHLRNVPPSPANYAQRQGRAGRHGQSSIVTTFCGTYGRYSTHDQYFFRFPERIIAGAIAPPLFLLDNRVLLEAHLHALVLELADYRVLAKPMQFLRMANDADVQAGLPMMEGVLDEINTKVQAAKRKILAAARGAFAAELANVGFTDHDMEALVDGFAEDFDHAFERFRDEYIRLQDERRELDAKSAHQGITKEDEIRRKAVVERLADMREGKGDFYTYRYLGNVGFLPNYAFPRRATMVYFTDRKESIARHPAIALREFAPLNTIYYRRQRYQVVRAQPRARGQAHHWSRLKLCACGHFFMDDQIAQAAACPLCRSNLMGTHTYERVFELPDMVARRIGRTSADEEERSRRGFIVLPCYRPDPQAVSWTLKAGEREVATVSYSKRGELLLVNQGARAADEVGFRYCEKCRAWILGDDTEQDHVDPNSGGRCPAGAEATDIHREVLLCHKGHHDFLLIELAVAGNQDAERFGWSLLYALSYGFQVAFSADESEVGGHVFSVPGGAPRIRLLLYEQDEGGAGLLRNLVGHSAWQRMATRALEIVHVDPATGQDMDGACDTACYDCLLSFYNQQHHRHLDRRVVVQALRQLLQIEPFQMAEPDGGTTWDQFRAAAIGAEPTVVDALQARNFPLPERQHEIIRDTEGVPVAEADLLYRNKIVVWVQGAPHQQPHLQHRDEDQKRRLKALGYRVVEIWPDHLDDGLRDLAQRLDRPDLP